jgi:CRISPR type III-A-associated RAMP protein Csm4
MEANNNNINIYKLHFTTPLHIGNERADNTIGTAILHSDTMYAAIFNAWATLGKVAWIPTETNPIDFGFTMSSFFPYQQSIYFLPRPLYSPSSEYTALTDTSIKKSIKKAAWIDTTIFENILNDTEPKFYNPENFKGDFWSASTILNAPITSQIMPRSKVREGNDTVIYYIERFYFAPDAGLYTMVQFTDDAAKHKFEAALRFLGDEGVGTDRNVGHGKFTFSLENAFTLNLKKDKGLAISLGLYCPESVEVLKQQIDNASIGYNLIKRGGWLSEPYNSWRKKNVYMLQEGSTLKMEGELTYQTIGQNIDIRPASVGHPVWRCGKTLFIHF